MIVLDPITDQQRKPWWWRVFGRRGNALHLPWWRASRHGSTQTRSCGEMGHGRSRCGAPSETGGVSASQLGVETTGSCGAPAESAAGTRQGLPAGDERRAGVSGPCPKSPSPPRRFGPRWGPTSGPAGHPRVGSCKPLTRAANESGRRAWQVGSGG